MVLGGRWMEVDTSTPACTPLNSYTTLLENVRLLQLLRDVWLCSAFMGVPCKIQMWDIVLRFFSGSKSALIGTTGGKCLEKTGIVTTLPPQYKYSNIIYWLLHQVAERG